MDISRRRPRRTRSPLWPQASCSNLVVLVGVIAAALVLPSPAIASWSSSSSCPLAWSSNEVKAWAEASGGGAAAVRALEAKGVETGADLYCLRTGARAGWPTGLGQAIAQLQSQTAPACRLEGLSWWPGQWCLVRGWLDWSALLLWLPTWLKAIMLIAAMPLPLGVLGRRLLRLAIKNEAVDLLALSLATLAAAALLLRTALLSALPSPLHHLLLPHSTGLDSALLWLPLVLAPLAQLRVTFGVHRLWLLGYSLLAMMPSLVLLAFQQQQDQQQLPPTMMAASSHF